METVDNLGSDSGYNKLISPVDYSTDENPLRSSRDSHQVSISVLRSRPCVTNPRRLTVVLALLAALLLTVNIGLGVYYHNLTKGQRALTHISNELMRVRASYASAIKGRDEATKQLATEANEQKLITWELEHQKKRSDDYRDQMDKMQEEIATLRSDLPGLGEGCRHCPPGWVWMSSRCFHFAFSASRITWQDARESCRRHGGDLAVIDSGDLQVSITRILNNVHDPARMMHMSGMWIGLTDEKEEGIWRWLDGTLLVEGYWNDGEPNNHYGMEDCAAVYPRENPFKSWNDAPCSHSLQWICEMPHTVHGLL